MVKDIQPRTPVAVVRRDFSDSALKWSFATALVAALVGSRVPRKVS